MKFENVPYVGAIMTAVAGWSINEWVAITGVVFTILTFLMNRSYKEKEYQLKLKELEHRLKVQELSGRKEADDD